MDDAHSILVGREVAARRLPVPASVSPQLQRSISTLAASGGLTDAQTPRTHAEWKAFIAHADQQTLASRPVLAGLFPHTEVCREIAGVTVREITPATLDPAKSGRRLVHFHGGGYALNAGEASTGEAVLAAHYAGTRAISVDYRTPPDHPFPAAVDDAVAVWRALLAEHAPSAMAAFGASAGGGLTLAMALKLKALGLPLPGALGCGTPWTDLTGASDSYRVNEGVDGIFSSLEGVARGLAQIYAGSTPLTDPLVSPVFGDFTGFPPTIFITGTRDILLSDTVRAYRAMRAAGVDARLEVHEAMSHAEYIFAFDAPESAVAFGDLATFFDTHLES
jgi:monoterpene epsilon-lactone hydrolase